jgi:lambda family phage portal protein
MRVVQIGSYDGARVGAPALKDWIPGNGSADSDTLRDLDKLRARSRDLRRNAPLVTGAFGTHLDSTIGIGLSPRATIDADFLGLSPEEADEWERRADRIWKLWADSLACDLTRRQRFPGIQRLTLGGMLESGDIIAIRRFVDRPGDPLSTRVQLVEADRLSNPNFKPDTDALTSGIEYDANGAPLAYHISERHPGDFRFSPLTWKRLPAFGARSGMPIVLHLAEFDRPGQSRGVPLLAPVIGVLKQLTRYTDAELQGAVLNAFFTVFVTTPTGEGGLQPINTEDAGDVEESELKLGSGLIADLAPGEDVKFADPKRPNQQFDAFVRALATYIGAAVGLPFELLIKHFTSSYSASRAALLEAWRGFLRRRGFFVGNFCQPVREWVITEAVIRGMLSAPRYFDDPLARQAWLGALWTGPVQGQIDPLAEIQAADLRMEIGVSTLEEETAQFTGGDWETNHRQRVKERDWQRRDGLWDPGQTGKASGRARTAVPPSQREQPPANQPQQPAPPAPEPEPAPVDQGPKKP